MVFLTEQGAPQDARQILPFLCRNFGFNGGTKGPGTCCIIPLPVSLMTTLLTDGTFRDRTESCAKPPALWWGWIIRLSSGSTLSHDHLVYERCGAKNPRSLDLVAEIVSNYPMSIWVPKRHRNGTGLPPHSHGSAASTGFLHRGPHAPMQRFGAFQSCAYPLALEL